MTDAARPTFTDALASASQHQELQMWRAAQLVRTRVSVAQDRDVILECLGLSEAVRPESR